MKNGNVTFRQSTEKVAGEKKVWKVIFYRNGFKLAILIEATEVKLNDYLETELPADKDGRGEPFWEEYAAASESEIAAAKTLGLPIYIYE